MFGESNGTDCKWRVNLIRAGFDNVISPIFGILAEIHQLSIDEKRNKSSIFTATC